MDQFDGRLHTAEPGALAFDPGAGPPMGRRVGPTGVSITHFAALETFDFAIIIEVPGGSGHVTTHYHEVKQELKYVVSGSILARYWDVADTGREEVFETTLTAGMIDQIEPGIVHSYLATDQDCVMVEIARNFTPEDIHHLSP